MSDETIRLERVAFHDPVDIPGTRSEEGAPPNYPTQEKIIGCYPKPKGMMAKQAFNLWFDRALNGVYIEHPESKEREFVPFSNVKQWRELRAEAAKPAALPPKPKGATEAAKPAAA